MKKINLIPATALKVIPFSAALLFCWPVLAQNLLINGDFSLGNFGFSSQYTFTTDLGPETTYVVGANPHDYHPGAWPMTDHTTGSGLMLIANGATIPGLSVWEETISVSAGQTYGFSGWAASWGNNGVGIDPSPAQLWVSINGSQVGSDWNLPAVDAEWMFFSGTWRASASGTAVIDIFDRNTDYYGNDFVLDDLSLQVPEPSVASFWMVAALGFLASGYWRTRRGKE